MIYVCIHQENPAFSDALNERSCMNILFYFFSGFQLTRKHVCIWNEWDISVNASTHLREYLRIMNYGSCEASR